MEGKLDSVPRTSNNTNELATTNTIHQYTNTITNKSTAANAIHQYHYYYQRTVTNNISNNESTATNNYPQSVGGNANAGGSVIALR